MRSKLPLKDTFNKQNPKIEATIIELPIKLRSERRLSRKLRTIFKLMGDVALIELSDFSSLPDFQVFADDLTDILEKDSPITAKSFRKNLRKKLGLGNVEAPMINQEIDHFIKTTVTQQSEYILSTTNKQIGIITIKTLEKASKEGRELTSQQLAKEVTSKFREGNRNRTNTIALTEVQRVAEKSKAVEADILTRAGKITPPQKRWDARLDSKTRSFHASADGQIVPHNEPFLVNGEYLKHPGDASLGASVKNLINCRCSAQYLTSKI